MIDGIITIFPCVFSFHMNVLAAMLSPLVGEDRLTTTLVHTRF